MFKCRQMYFRGRPSALVVASVLVATTMSSIPVVIPTLPDSNSLVVDRPQQTTQQTTPQNKVPAVPNSNFVPIYIPFRHEDEKRFVSDDEDSPTATRSNFSDFLCIHSAPFEHAPVHKPP
ncbi:MAG: hypothetical protein RLY49_229 [Candidatus Parcubacteria bacterium]|jgi:hypothetical protein